MILDVPYKSQETIEEGQRRDWCALTCLWMVMSYYLKDAAPSLEDLHQKYGLSLKEKEYFDTIGIEHRDLLAVAREYGLRGFRKSWWVKPGVEPLLEKFKAEGETEQDIEDWERTNLEESLCTIESFVNHGIPVILSVSKDFSPSQATHLLVLIGVEHQSFVIHDPYKKGGSFKISKEEFKKYFLKQAIVIVPGQKV